MTDRKGGQVYEESRRDIGGFRLLALMVGPAQATLFDRGNGLIYDSFDNLSWTQDAAISVKVSISSCRVPTDPTRRVTRHPLAVFRPLTGRVRRSMPTGPRS